MNKLLLLSLTTCLMFSCNSGGSENTVSETKQDSLTSQEVEPKEEKVVVWSQVDEVDEFGDKTGETKWNAKFDATYSNDNVSNAPATISFLTLNNEKDSVVKMLITITDGLDIKKEYAGLYDFVTLRIKDDQGDVHEIKTMPLKGLGLYEETGKLWGLLKDNGSKTLKVSIDLRDTYTFKIVGVNLSK